jgi:transcriptional regulator with XRE-family HTH domain
MTFKELIKKIVKENNISLDKARFEIAENIGRSLSTIKNWESGNARPNLIEADKLQRLISKLYKIDVDIYKVFIETKK